MNQKQGAEVQSRASRPIGPADKKPFSYPVTELRRLKIAASSLRLAQFNEIVEAAGGNTKVEQINQ